MVLEATEAVDRLGADVEEFRRRAGRQPGSLAELQASGLARAPLVDAAGVPFEYDVETGRVTVSRRSYLRRDDLMGREAR
jgi:hypothetical protein